MDETGPGPPITKWLNHSFLPRKDRNGSIANMGGSFTQSKGNSRSRGVGAGRAAQPKGTVFPECVEV